MATTNTAATLIDRALKRIEEVKETLFKTDEYPQSQVSHEKQYLNDIARGNWKLKHNDSICIRTVPVVGFPSGYVQPVFKMKMVERRPFLTEICNGYKLRHVEFNFINDRSVPNLDKQAFKLKTAVDYKQFMQEVRTFSDSTHKLKHVTSSSDRSAPQISDIRMSKFFQADSNKVTQEKSKDIDTEDKGEKHEKSKDHKKEKKGKHSEKDLDTKEHDNKEGKIKHDKEGKKSEKKKDKSDKKSHDEKHSKKDTKGKGKDEKEGSKKKKTHEDHEVSHKKDKKDHHSKKNKEGKKGKKNHSDEETTTKTIEIYEREEITEFKEDSKDHGTKGDKKSKKHEKSKDHENTKNSHHDKHQVFIMDGDKHKNDNVPITVAIDKTGAS